ncbi:hypothetical protein [Desulfuribacillus alkaliarsenatis]|uniref:Uncharacterized protein n=1 Tax=Desulfuribacillus alkaliarsenatis TaxID=766136 RepID=A0A1E5FZL4_9FIRM|nr:hypothetical protein [Desulfuribacillus alkaliarsenatis]OEF95970.1 hypothetical protein BHF68_09465 [Desulfuribacillus alkaliarsenatis]
MSKHMVCIKKVMSGTWEVLSPLKEKHESTEKEDHVKVIRSRISPYYSEGGRAVYKGKGETEVCIV